MAMTASARSVQSEINITPLVDVVLVLLIIFMVATPILQMGLDVEVPPKVEVTGPPPTDQLAQLVINIRYDGIYLNKEKIANPKDLRDRLAPIMVSRADKDRIVFVNAEDQVIFDRAVEAMDAAHAAGARKIGFLTDPPK
jgi:biopolymer transport protein ExbD